MIRAALLLLISLPAWADGILWTASEVSTWAARASTGPYKSAGDESLNSPGDWDHITGNAAAFTADPDLHRWTGQTSASCWIPAAPSPRPASREHGMFLRDAAFIHLVQGNTTYRDQAITELLAQAGEAGTDFSDRTRWCFTPPGFPSGIGDGYSHDITGWLTVLILAYDYIRADMTASQRSTMDAWFLEAARFWGEVANMVVEQAFPNRDSDDYTGSPFTGSTGCTYGTCLTHYQGNAWVNFHEHWNNRNAKHVLAAGLVGIMLGDAALKSDSKKYFEEWLQYGVFPDSTDSDHRRWTDSGTGPYPSWGWSYSTLMSGEMAILAEAFHRSGDDSLYTFSTSAGFSNNGVLTPAGGPKSLLSVIELQNDLTTGAVVRYGTDEAAKANSTYQISSVNNPTGDSWVHDTMYALSNSGYYQSSELEAVYKRTAAGAPNYPSNPTHGGYNAWGGPWGYFPGVLFQYAYDLTPATTQERPEINGTFEASCRAAGVANCLINQVGAVPSGKDSALVVVRRKDYVTVQGLALRDSAARGLNLSGQSGDNAVGHIIQDLIIDGIAYVGIAGELNLVNIEIRDNELSRMTWCEKWQFDGETNANSGVDLGTCFAAGQPPCLVLNRSRNSYSIIENNKVYNGRCEAINLWGSSYVAIMGNVTAGTGLAVHNDKALNNVIMRNIFLGNPDDGDRFAVDNGQQGIDLSLEGNYSQYDGGENIIAANIIAGGSAGVAFTNITDANLGHGNNTGAYIYGNTIIGTTTSGFGMLKNNDTAYEYVGVVNNLIFTSATPCNVASGVTDQIDLNQYNFWPTAGSGNSACDDATDQSGPNPLPQTEAWYTALDDTNIGSIGYDDFRLPSGASNAKSNGSLPVSLPAWVNNTLTASGWSDITIEGGGISACGAGMPADLNEDADCVARSAVNIGALETNL